MVQTSIATWFAKSSIKTVSWIEWKLAWDFHSLIYTFCIIGIQQYLWNETATDYSSLNHECSELLRFSVQIKSTTIIDLKNKK